MLARDNDGPIPARVIEKAEEVFGLQVLASTALPPPPV
jgi:hypothetical protein